MAVDPEKASIYKRYLAKAIKRMSERDVVRERLKAQLEELRAMDPQGMKKRIDELERTIVASLQREGSLRAHHEQEDLFHRKLRDRMDVLEKQIATYLATREERLKRIADLEDKVAARLSDKTEQLSALQIEIGRLEKLADDLEDEPKAVKRLTKLRSRIDEIKKDIAAKAVV